MAIQILNILEEETRTKTIVTIVNLKTEGTFLNVLKGCFVKSFEYAVVCHSDLMEDRFFFLAPVLRGICEDFIVLRYLQVKKTEKERDELLFNKAKQLIFESVDKQKKFFAKHRPFQPIFYASPKAPSPKIKLPHTQKMANEVELDDLYDFLFAVTSDIVHFNPRIIIRNAWGENEQELKPSTKNFDLYYQNFCRTYSLYLFCKFSQTFKLELNLSEIYLSSILELEQDLNEQLRWPEAVTYEEMNKDGPKEIMRILMKSNYESQNSENSDI